MCSADLHDVHEMLKTLGTAVKALQKHVSTGNKDIERVRVSCATDCQGLRIEMRRQEKVVNGYMESWSVESAGMTEQVLQLWKFVRTSSSSAERGKKEAYHTARVNKDYGKIAAAQEYAIEEKAEGGGGAGNGELGALGDSVEGDGSARSSASSGLGIEM